MEDDQAHTLGAGKGAHGGSTRVAGGRGNQRQGLVPLTQGAAGQLGHHLHRHVLEGHGRTVPELEQPEIVVKLGQGHGPVGAQEGLRGRGTSGFR